MPTIYHDADADPKAIEGEQVTVIGYGNQGRSQALNLRDSGVDVTVGNIDDDYRQTALAEGFTVLPIADATKAADCVIFLLPDEIMQEIYDRDMAPNLAPGNLVDFASGYNIAFDLVKPDASLDVVMIAPRMFGPAVRTTYESGEGFASFVGVHQDATGRALARMLALAHAMGSTRAGCIEMTMHDEASLDLFTEQAFGPAFGRVMTAALETLVDAGYPPEAAYLELMLSGEFAASLEHSRQIGMGKSHLFHSHTSQYGTITRSPRFMDLDASLKEKMGNVLEEIRSGAFAQEWSTDREGKLALLDKAREARGKHHIAIWEDQTRKAFRIGDAADES